MTKQSPFGSYAVYSLDKWQALFPNAVPAGRYDNLDGAKAHADSVTYKMVVVDMKAESRGFIYTNWEQTNYRTHTCPACKHQWTSRVILSDHSPAISGERTEQCPKCNSRGVSSSPWHTDIAPTESPWGHVQYAKRREAGIWFVSTASHGGYWLNEQRQAELHEIEAFKPFGPQWLEEDCEAAIVALRWPGYSTDEQIADAISMAKVVACWDGCTRWKPVVDWLATTMLHERAERHQEAVKQLWQRGGMSTSGGCWTVWFRRGEETRTVSMNDYPTKRYYTDAELAAITPVPPPEKKRSPFPDHCFVGNGYDFEPSDADPGL